MSVDQRLHEANCRSQTTGHRHPACALIPPHPDSRGRRGTGSVTNGAERRRNGPHRAADLHLGRPRRRQRARRRVRHPVAAQRPAAQAARADSGQRRGRCRHHAGDRDLPGRDPADDAAVRPHRSRQPHLLRARRQAAGRERAAPLGRSFRPDPAGGGRCRRRLAQEVDRARLDHRRAMGGGERLGRLHAARQQQPVRHQGGRRSAGGGKPDPRGGQAARTSPSPPASGCSIRCRRHSTNTAACWRPPRSTRTP